MVSLIRRIKSQWGSLIVAIYAMLIGCWFLLEQTLRLFLAERTEAEVAEMAIGRFDWGFIWADTFLPGPLLFIGGLILSSSENRIGHLFVFAGFAINLYAMIVFLVGLNMLGEPVPGGEMVGGVVATILGVFCMIHSAKAIAKG